MTNYDLTSPPQKRSDFRQTLLISFLAAISFSMLHILNAPSISKAGDLGSTDDIVRMVMVRDLLAGQSWFDPHLYRLGIEPGTMMHWSRLVDAPIALLIIVGNLFGKGGGENFAAFAWPIITFVAAIAGLLTGVRRASGSRNVLPALIIGGFALSMSGVFTSGVVDHHNVQLALTMWLFALLLPSPTLRRDFMLAAIIAALMMAIGMEALPIIAAAMCMICFHLLTPTDDVYDAVSRFGLALAVSTIILFLALTAPALYGSNYCDSFSLFHLVCASVGGLILFVGFLPNIRAKISYPNLAVPIFGAVAVALLVSTLFPHCLGNPLGNLDPLVVKFWLSGVQETQSFASIASLDPWLLVVIVVLPILAIVASIIAIFKDRSDIAAKGLLIFVLITLAITSIQLRGGQFATPLAALALSIYVTRFAEGAGKERQWALLCAMVISCALFWKMTVLGAMSLFGSGEAGPLIASDKAKASASCESDASIASLNAEKTGFIAAANNFGPIILYKTAHHALAGPYHRNNAGNLAWIKAMIGNDVESKQILQDAKVTMLAICPADPDAVDFLAAAPKGFLANLLKGQTYDWLEPVTPTMDQPLKLWRVAPR